MEKRDDHSENTWSEKYRGKLLYYHDASEGIGKTGIKNGFL